MANSTAIKSTVSKTGDTMSGKLIIDNPSINNDGKIEIWKDGEGGNISIVAPNGSVMQFDFRDDTLARMYTVKNGVYKMVEMNAETGEITLPKPLQTSSGGTGQSSIDSTPTSGSQKMVTSGGVYTALSNTIQKNVDSQTIKNPNGSTSLILSRNDDTGVVYLTANTEGGNVRLKKGNSHFEIDTNGFQNDQTGFARLYFGSTSTELIKQIKIYQNGTIEDANGNNTSSISLKANITDHNIFFYNGIICKSLTNNSVIAYGVATIELLPNNKAILYFSGQFASNMTNLSNTNYSYGIDANLFTSKIGKTITPVSGGVLKMYASDGSLIANLNGYGGTFSQTANRYWTPARVYSTEGAIGAWAEHNLQNSMRIEGMVIGTY